MSKIEILSLEKDKFETMFAPYPDIMSVKDVMSALGICKHGVYHLIESGEIAGFRIGRAHKIPKCALISYVKRTMQEETGR